MINEMIPEQFALTFNMHVLVYEYSINTLFYDILLLFRYSENTQNGKLDTPEVNNPFFFVG